MRGEWQGRRVGRGGHKGSRLGVLSSVGAELEQKLWGRTEDPTARTFVKGVNVHMGEPWGPGPCASQPEDPTFKRCRGAQLFTGEPSGHRKPEARPSCDLWWGSRSGVACHSAGVGGNTECHPHGDFGRGGVICCCHDMDRGDGGDVDTSAGVTEPSGNAEDSPTCLSTVPFQPRDLQMQTLGKDKGVRTEELPGRIN